jgi:rhomboid protease GluP
MQAASFGKRKAAPAQFMLASAARREHVGALQHAEDSSDLYGGVARLPLVTLGLIVLLVIVYWAEVHIAFAQNHGSPPGAVTLTALGGLDGTLAVQGEWWRVFTAPLLHSSTGHLLGNAVALFFAGLVLERLIGATWFAALFVLCALGGAAGSLALNPSNVVSVGASGAIVGLLAVAFVCSFLFESEQLRRRMRKISLRFLLPSLLPALLPIGLASTSHVDYGAHIGGAVAGAVLGFMLSEIWAETEPKPPLRRAALWIAVVGLAAATLSFAFVATRYSAYASQEDILIPEQDLPRSADDAAARSAALVDSYPRDPRAHLFRATYFLESRNLAEAERQLRLGLKQRDVLAVLPSNIQRSLQIVLSVVLVYEGRKDEAKTMAAPFCGGASIVEFRQLHQILETEGICI